MEKATLNVQELAKTLSIGSVTAYQLVNSPGFYPAFRIGRKILINREKLQEWLNDQTAEGQSNENSYKL